MKTELPEKSHIIEDRLAIITAKILSIAEDKKLFYLVHMQEAIVLGINIYKDLFYIHMRAIWIY